MPRECGSDGRLDGDETDIDCGGACAPCAATRDCARDADCVTSSCDRLLPHRCLLAHCADHHLNADETDVDCGGSCAGCAVGEACVLDQDCASDACEPVAKICLAATCIDQQRDGDETDFDCGGSCGPCVPGFKCLVNADCASEKCDSTLHQCGGNHCLDGRLDVDETDLDCGGLNGCSRCTPGHQCTSNADCAVGHPCDASDVCG